MKYLLIVFAICSLPALALAQIPRTLSYQGTLANKSGGPVADGTHTMVLNLYASRTGKVVLYSKSVSVVTSNGLFNTLLDSIPDTLVFDKQLYLGISIDGDPELSPRTPLTAAAYSLSPSTATAGISQIKSDGSLNIISPAGPTASVTIATGGVTNTKLADGAVTNTKIGDAAVTNAKIQSVDWTKITNTPAISSKPTGAAGGDLIGTYPDPQLRASGVTPGTYTYANISVDAEGRILTATNGTTPAPFLLPYSGTQGDSTTSLQAVNTKSVSGGATAIRGVTYSNSSSALGNAGVVGENLSSGNFAYGVVGKSHSNYDSSAGVFGVNDAASGTGVLGRASIGVTGISSQSNGAGVAGSGYYGVEGFARATSSSAGIYGGSNGTGTYAGYFAGNVSITGTLTIGGSKSAVVPIDSAGNEWRKLYCEEAADVWFADYGSAALVNGRAHVELDPVFLRTVTIDPTHPMLVFIQPNGETAGTFVQKGMTGFDVIELAHGTSNAPFDYRIVARRRGYESTRLERAPAMR